MKQIKNLARNLSVILCMLLLWESIIYFFNLPIYILPSPLQVISLSISQIHILIQESIPTVIEMTIGLSLGTLLGVITALTLIYFKTLNRWLMPLIVMSQSMPIFALAPLLVLWLGYGMASKIATTALILFFPITSSFVDGLRRTDRGWLELAKVMGANKWQLLWRIRIPAALPALASGMRIATVAAPLGAVIGEWVGASRGLGFLILNANARVQIDMMFAAVFILILIALSFYFVMDKFLKFMIPWQVETH